MNDQSRHCTIRRAAILPVTFAALLGIVSWTGVALAQSQNPTLEVLQTYDLVPPDSDWYVHGIAWDGATIWTATTSSWTSRIYRHTLDAQLTGELWSSPSRYVQALAFKDGTLWSNDQGSNVVLEYNMSDGSVAHSYDPNTRDGPGGIVWDGQRWWSTSHEYLQRHRNDGSLSVEQSYTLPGITSLGGLAWDGSQLWMIDSAPGQGRVVHRLDYNAASDQVSVDGTYDFPNASGSPYLVDITFDGENLWLADHQNKVYKVRTPGLADTTVILSQDYNGLSNDEALPGWSSGAYATNEAYRSGSMGAKVNTNIPSSMTEFPLIQGVVSFEIWMKPEASSDTNNGFHIGSSKGFADGTVFWKGSDGVWWYHGDPSEGAQQNSLGSYDGQWHHFRVVYTTASNRYDLYMDGALVANDVLWLYDVSSGISRVGVHSGRWSRENDTTSHFDDLEVYVMGRPVAVSATQVCGTTGGAIAVSVRAADLGGIAGGDITVSYDVSELSAVDVRPGDGLSTNGFTFASNLSTPGEVRVSTAGAASLPSGAGELFTIEFSLSGSAGDGPFAIELGKVALRGVTSAQLPVYTEDGAARPNPKRGDVNGDDRIDSGDAIVILRSAAGLDSLAQCLLGTGDVNCDGNLDSGDAILVLRYAVGLIDVFPCDGAAKPLANRRPPMPVGATVSKVDGLSDERSSVVLFLVGAGSVAGGDLVLSYDSPVGASPDVSLLGLPPGAVSVVNADTPGRVCISFASAQEAGPSVDIRLRIDLSEQQESGYPDLKLEGKLYDAWGQVVGEVRLDQTMSVGPVTYALHRNHPNPFNPATTIRYDLPQPGNVRVAIYSVTGQLVRTLVDGYLPSGLHTVEWDGTDSDRRLVGSGTYLYRMTVDRGQFTAVRRMVYLK